MVLQSLGLSITDLEAAGADPYYLITCRMLYNEFSGDLEDAYKNKDVMVEVAEERKLLYNQCFSGMTWPHQSGPRFPERCITNRESKSSSQESKVSKSPLRAPIFTKAGRLIYGKKTRQS